VTAGGTPSSLSVGATAWIKRRFASCGGFGSKRHLSRGWPPTNERGGTAGKNVTVSNLLQHLGWRAAGAPVLLEPLHDCWMSQRCQTLVRGNLLLAGLPCISRWRPRRKRQTKHYQFTISRACCTYTTAHPFSAAGQF
jgi:hypothetical protein